MYWKVSTKSQFHYFCILETQIKILSKVKKDFLFDHLILFKPLITSSIHRHEIMFSDYQ